MCIVYQFVRSFMTCRPRPTVHPTVPTGRDRGTYHQNVVDALQRERVSEERKR